LEPSRSSVDRLGERLRRGSATIEDLQGLEVFRQSFYPAYESVVETVVQRLELSPTGRPAKSTQSVVAKLRRESFRLSQIQDIAGCRLVVADLAQQDAVLARLLLTFPEAAVADRREHPSHGYRAVHVIPKINGRPVELQIRTELQHSWAEISEKCSDVFDPQLKYGGGPEALRQVLAQFAAVIQTSEAQERQLTEIQVRMQKVEESKQELLSTFDTQPPPSDMMKQAAAMREQSEAMIDGYEDVRKEVADSRKAIVSLMRDVADAIERARKLAAEKPTS